MVAVAGAIRRACKSTQLAVTEVIRETMEEIA